MQALAAFRADVADHLATPINPGQWMRWWARQLHRALDELLATAASLTDADLARMLGDPNLGRPTTRWAFVTEIKSW